MRSFKTAFTEPMLRTYQAGVMAYRHKGVPCLKSPLDIGIYMRLLWDLQPKTFFEIGSRSGGSALLFADILGNMGCGGVPVISIDIRLPEGVEDMPAPPKKPAPPDPEAWPATNLFRRLAAFSRLLDDLPRHAARLVRWRARRAAETGRFGITDPMRGGHAPGRQKGGRHEADSILHDCHMHALHAYDHPGELTPDTS